jgi:hypothetical protein
MSSANPYVAAVTAIVGADESVNAGRAAAANARVAAHYDDVDANNTQIAAQQIASQDRKQARYLRSKALARAGASGAGAHDAQVTDILSGIDKEGEMNALNALWSGDMEARALKAHARATRTNGQAAQAAYQQQGITAFAKGAMDFARSDPGQSFFEKYGGDRASAQTIGMGTGYSDLSSGPAQTEYNA